MYGRSCPTSLDCNFTHSAGALPDVVPFHFPIGGWAGDPSWGAAGAVIPREIVVTRGETATPELYSVVKSLVDFFNSHGDSKTDGVVTFGYYGDWLDLAPHTPRPQVTGFSHLLSIHRLVEIATAAGNVDDAASYNETLLKLKAAYHKAYWDGKTQSYGASQTANLLPLYLDITPAALVPAATKAYVDAVTNNNNLTNSGIIGSAYMLQTLAKVGHGDIALRIALATSEPSWGNMVIKGPGTIWESWTDSTNSHNHPALSADIGVFLYTLAGVEPSRWGRGADRQVTFTLDTLTAETVGAAYVHVASEGGRASFSWDFDPAKSFEINATIPHGEQGTVELLIPGSSAGSDSPNGVNGSQCHKLTSSRTLVWKSSQVMETAASMAMLMQNGIYAVKMGATKLVVSVGSGEHSLLLQPC